MNQGFKLRFDQMRDGDPTPPAADEQGAAPGFARNLCLAWPDGRRFFLAYAHLVAGELRLDGEANEIRLEFSAHTVVLRGYRLETLFAALLDHRPALIAAIDERYAAVEDDAIATVLDIRVEPKRD